MKALIQKYFAAWMLVWCALAASVTLTGCLSVHLIADYDQKIDEGVTELQRKTEVFFVKLERVAGKPEAEYQANTAFYDGVKVDLAVLQTRADSVALNKQTSEQLRLLRENFVLMEKMHADSGKLSPIVIGETRKQMNRGFVAILTLEVAKKNRVGSKE